MIFKILLLILASVASALLYRLGGAKGYNTKYRDAGCSIVSCIMLGYLVGWHWTLILVFGATWGSLTTYWKRTPNAKWYNWLMTGAMYSVAVLPYCIAEGHWLGFASRTIILGTTTMLWSELNSNAVWEETGRGALLILTLPLLLVSS
jgi:hypothetical protein